MDAIIPLLRITWEDESEQRLSKGLWKRTSRSPVLTYSAGSNAAWAASANKDMKAAQ